MRAQAGGDTGQDATNVGRSQTKALLRTVFDYHALSSEEHIAPVKRRMRGPDRNKLQQQRENVSVTMPKDRIKPGLGRCLFPTLAALEGNMHYLLNNHLFFQVEAEDIPLREIDELVLS